MSSTFRLLLTRRLGPFFFTQLTGAYNDNVFRNALVVLITYRITELAGFGSEELVAASAGVFLLPFLLFSALGGKLADHFPRHRLIQHIKLAECALMALTWIGFVTGSVGFLFAILFLTGLQSALFGPVKYAILPNLLPRAELLAGNAWVAVGTFISILAGSLTGTLLMGVPDASLWVPGILVVSAAAGYLASHRIPAQPSGNTALRLSFEPFSETSRILREGLNQPRLAWLMLSISWFWMIGVGLLIQLPLFVRDVLAGNEQALAGALAIFTVGIGLGALLCNRWLGGTARATWAPLAAAGLGAGFVLLGLVPPAEVPLRGFDALLEDPQAVTTLGILLAVAVAGGFYVTPLYTMVQQRAPEERRARIIACNNILNSIFMALASVGSIVIFQSGGTIVTVWLAMATTAAATALILLHITQGSFRHILLWPVASVTLTSETPPPGSLVFVRRGSAWAAWALAATIPGKLEIYLEPSLLRRASLRLLACWVRLRPLNPSALDSQWPGGEDEPSHVTLILPSAGPEGQASLLELMQIARQRSGRPVEVAHVSDPELYMPRFYPRIRVGFESCPLPPRAADEPGTTRRDALKIYDLLCELEYRMHSKECTTLQSLYGAVQRLGGNRSILADLERTLTYRQLLRAAHAVAQLLERALPKTQDTVGILLPNAVATPITFFALHALHRIPVMLNYTAGPSNLASACRTAGLTHIVTSRRFIEKADLGDLADALAKDYTLVWLEDLRSELSLGMKLLAAWRAVRMPAGGDASDPAVVLFTSGSEGEPKGVVLSHRNLQRNRCQVRAVLDLTPEDHLLLCLPTFHSFALGVGLLLPLMSGLRCTLYPSPLHYKQIPELIRKLGITVFFSTDTFLNGYGQAADREDLQSLHLIVAGAEPLKSSTRKFWQERFGLTVHEGYGVTETSPAVSVNTLACNRPGSVGRLMPEIEARLEPLDDSQDSADSTRGRLFLRGPNVMSGYWLPGESRLLTPPEDGWHDTGDVAEFDDDGFLSLHGRAKRFAKIGGEMISLAYVEQQVSEVWPESRHIVCAIDHPTRGEQLVLITEHPEPDRGQLRQALGEQGVGELARPRLILPVEALPLLGSGKPDLRRAQELALSVLH
ncbi:MAG: MFS transporter [Gammaproteobacteria bacterium]|nr:MFS transporter [Gammaproteobacteria bacterium]